MKKIMSLLIILFLMSGCTVEYNLVIDENNNFIESVNINAQTSSESTEIAEYKFPFNAFYNDTFISEEPTILDDVEYYTYAKNFINPYYELSLNYTFDDDNFAESFMINNCYQYSYITTSGNYLTISTSSENLCFEKYPPIEKITITITINNEVFSHNADSVINNTYTWVIDENNYTSRAIIISYEAYEQSATDTSNTDNTDTSDNVDTDTSTENNNEISIAVVILVIVVTIGLLFGALYFNFKQQNHD